MMYVSKYQWLQDKRSIYLFWKKFWSIWSLGSRHWTLKYSEKVMLKSLSLIFKTSEMWISMPICRISERISYIVSPLFRNKSKISISSLFIIVFYVYSYNIFKASRAQARLLVITSALTLCHAFSSFDVWERSNWFKLDPNWSDLFKLVQTWSKLIYVWWQMSDV